MEAQIAHFHQCQQCHQMTMCWDSHANEFWDLYEDDDGWYCHRCEDESCNQ